MSQAFVKSPEKISYCEKLGLFTWFGPNPNFHKFDFETEMQKVNGDSPRSITTEASLSLRPSKSTPGKKVQKVQVQGQKVGLHTLL